MLLTCISELIFPEKAFFITYPISVETNDKYIVHGDKEVWKALHVIAAVTSMKRDIQQVFVFLSGLCVNIHIIMQAPRKKQIVYFTTAATIHISLSFQTEICETTWPFPFLNNMSRNFFLCSLHKN